MTFDQGVFGKLGTSTVYMAPLFLTARSSRPPSRRAKHHDDLQVCHCRRSRNSSLHRCRVFDPADASITFLNGVAWQEELLVELQTRDPELAKYRYLGSDLQLDELQLAALRAI